MIRAILMDIEGTTTSISFVHETLFPYSWERMDAFMQKNQNHPEVAAALNEVECTMGEEGTPAGNTGDMISALKQWILDDRKHPALKVIQGLIWKEGYETGDIKGHVYDDVPKAFEEWRAKGLTLAIYSSGSVLAQRLIFGYSSAGDLNPYISANFDTGVGAKREEKSYTNIAKQMRVAPREILFLSDIPQELMAARSAGFNVTQIVRPGTVAHEAFPKAKDFSQVQLDAELIQTAE